MLHRPRRWPTLAALLALAPPTALAQDGGSPPRNGYDGDLDLVRPMFTPEVLPGIDVPDNERGGTVRFGLATWYMRNPLVLYEFDEEIGPVVANRISGVFGLSVDITRRITARASLPLHFQWGSQVPRYAADGFAVGDMGLGFHWAFFRKPNVGLGIRADLAFPTSRREFYSGERMPRINPAFLMMFDAGRVRFASDLGVNVRFADVVTTEEFTLGTELVWNNGLRVTVLPEQLALGLSIYSRFGFANFFGAAESAGEALINVAYGPVPMPANLSVTANLAGGRGFTRGYGSSDFRGFLELTFQRIQPPKPEDEGFVEGEQEGAEGDKGLQFNVRDIGIVQGGQERELTDEPEWEEGELARIDRETERIRIRYAINFVVGTDELLPESLPTLDYVAGLLNGDARIAHMVIEGHASTDGEFEPNYKLSINRAAAIWRRLIEMGVHPSRISFRGMGEVVPTEATGGFDEKQASRRVVFYIVEQLEEWETAPEYDLAQKYPWNGNDYRAVQPRMPTADEIIEGIVPLRTPPAQQEDTLEDVDFGAPPDEEEEEPVFEDEEDGSDASEEAP